MRDVRVLACGACERVSERVRNRDTRVVTVVIVIIIIVAVILVAVIDGRALSFTDPPRGGATPSEARTRSEERETKRRGQGRTYGAPSECQGSGGEGTLFSYVYGGTAHTKGALAREGERKRSVAGDGVGRGT